MHDLRDFLGLVDAYAGFDASRHPTDPQGWGSDHPFFEAILRAIRPNQIIEVGSWKGASAINMGRLARQMDLPVEILCVDTWLGSWEHYITPDPMPRRSLAHVNGYPSLYYTFLANVVAAGLSDCITPFALTSDGAAHVMRNRGVRVPFIYIDAAHDLDAALRDIGLYWDLLTEDGVMLCDDYGYSEVTEAVCQFARSVNRAVYASYGKALLCKRMNRVVMMTLDRIE